MDHPAAPWLPLVTAPLAPPVGMRDLLGPRVARRRAFARAVAEAAARYGYEPVVTPAFEREEVLRRGISAGDAGDLVRLVDPDTGEVLALRPDMTPQVARIAVTHLQARPLPLRLAYEGSVLRRPRGRARRHRQLAQAGVECLGWASPEADHEVLRVTLEALRDCGIEAPVVELSHAAPLRRALALAPAGCLDDAADAVARKDRVAWRFALRDAPVAAEWLGRCADLAGAADATLERAQHELADLLDEAERADLRTLADLAARLDREGLAARVLVDLGELRSRTYYTGSFFQVFVDGVGAPIAAGGRYDQLLAGFGRELPATGAAVFLDALEEHLGDPPPEVVERVVVAGPREHRAEAAAALRRTGARVIERDDASDEELQRFTAGHGAARFVRVSP